MVSITNVSAGQASSYYRQDNYYLATSGHWQGKGAEALGLSGEIRDVDFEALLSGKDPHGRFEIQAGGEDRTRRAGIDLTFSAPKSVSILAGVCGDERVREAHERAVAQTLLHIERHYARARQTGDGITQKVNTGNLVMATFEHNTSRELDPQIHTHCVVLNMTRRPDGQWRALSNEDIYRQKMFIGQYYRNELARNLTELGYSVQSDHRGLFEVQGVDSQLLSGFSRRKEQIDARVEELRHEFPSADASKLREMACLDSRKPKDHHLNLETVRQSWRERTEQAGKDVDRVRAEAEKAGETAHRSMTAEEIVMQAAEIETESQSTFKKEDVLKTAGKLSIGEYRISDLEQVLEKEKEIIRLSENTYTTREMQTIEAKVIETVREGRGATEAIQEKPELPSHLTAGQRQAAEHILTTEDRYVVVQGDAGTGKTTMLATVREQAQRAGWEVRGLAPTGKAAEELSRGAGIEARTIDSYLISREKETDSIREKVNKRFDEYHEKISSSSLDLQKKHDAIKKLEDSRAEVLDKLPTARDHRPTLYVVDEAGMIGSKKLHETLEKVKQEDPRAKVVFIGDEKQFQSIEAGRIFRDIQEKTGLEVQHLSEIQRQKDESYRSITTDLSHRKIEQALKKMESQGRITEVQDRDERLHTVASAYLSDPEHSLVVTAHNRDRNELNRMIRDELKNEGRIAREEYTFTVRESKNLSPVEKHFAQSYQPGDIVISNRADRGLLGRAGTEARVISVDETNHTIRVRTRDMKTHEIDLKTRGQDLSVFAEKKQKFSQNDRVIFLKNDRSLNLKNGQTGTVKSIDFEGRATVKLDTGETKKINLRSQYNYSDHAYCVTSYKSQGQTVDRVIYHADTSRETNFNELYVAATRGRHDLKIYTDSGENFKEQAGIEIEKTSTLDRTLDRAVERGEN